jgi:hypothetical protein
MVVFFTNVTLLNPRKNDFYQRWKSDLDTKPKSNEN